MLLAVLGLAGCGRFGDETAASQTLTIFAAASLTNAFSEMGAAFTAANPNAAVVFNFAGSSQLAAQLREGAAADVFASANPAQMQAVIDAGLIDADATIIFASNRLAIIVPADNPAAVETLADLARPGVQMLLAAPGVPVRTYTDELVAAMPSDFQRLFYANVVSEEDNVRQVAAKVALGEADAGIVYTTDVTPDIITRIQQVPIPEAENVTATYPIAPLVDAPHPELAQRFIDFVRSEAGQRILAHWGFDSK